MGEISPPGGSPKKCNSQFRTSLFVGSIFVVLFLVISINCGVISINCRQMGEFYLGCVNNYHVSFTGENIITGQEIIFGVMFCYFCWCDTSKLLL